MTIHVHLAVFFDDTGPPFNDFIYWMIPFWLNLSYSIHSLQRLFTYNLRHFSLALSNHCSADGNVRGLPRILKSRSRILECMLTKKVGFELGAWSKHYLALISRREYEAAQRKNMAGGCDVELVETLFWTNRNDWRLLFES